MVLGRVRFPPCPRSNEIHCDTERMGNEMTIETLEDLEAAKTFREFFSDLSTGTYVRRTIDERDCGTYIYHSFMYEPDNDGQTSILLFDAKYGDRYIVRYDAAHFVNDIFSVITEDGEPKRASEFITFLLASKDSYQRDSVRHFHERISATTKLEEVLSDVKKLNDQMNDFASNNTYYGTMCGMYEEQLTKWNEELTAFQLVGRPKEFTVPVNINGSRFYLRVDGYHTESEAAEAVRKLSPGQIMAQLVEDGANFYNFTFEVDGQELSDEPPF